MVTTTRVGLRGQGYGADVVRRDRHSKRGRSRRWSGDATSPRRASARAAVGGGGGGKDDSDLMEPSTRARLRTEAVAPFRTFRKFIWGGLAASAAIGTGIASLQGITGLLGAPNAPPVSQTFEAWIVDVIGLVVMVTLYNREEASFNKSMLSFAREEQLAGLRIELSSGKLSSMESLRGAARPVIVAGSTEEVEAAMTAADAMRADLESSGIILVPVVLEADGSAGPQLDARGEADLRYRCTPIKAQQWSTWIRSQKDAAKLAIEKPVWLSLRQDGRIRASGVGAPPFARLAAELPPMTGELAGFDGSVDALK